MNQLLPSVIAHINKAKRAEDQATMIYLDRQGDLDTVAVAVEGPDDEEWALHLAEEPSKPYFEICTVKDGNVMNRDGDGIDNGDNESLKEAINNAVENRKQFFKEQKGEPELWPVAS